MRKHIPRQFIIAIVTVGVGDYRQQRTFVGCGNDVHTFVPVGFEGGTGYTADHRGHLVVGLQQEGLRQPGSRTAINIAEGQFIGPGFQGVDIDRIVVIPIGSGPDIRSHLRLRFVVEIGPFDAGNIGRIGCFAAVGRKVAAAVVEGPVPFKGGLTARRLAGPLVAHHRIFVVPDTCFADDAAEAATDHQVIGVHRCRWNTCEASPRGAFDVDVGPVIVVVPRSSNMVPAVSFRKIATIAHGTCRCIGCTTHCQREQSAIESKGIRTVFRQDRCIGVGLGKVYPCFEHTPVAYLQACMVADNPACCSVEQKLTADTSGEDRGNGAIGSFLAIGVGNRTT